MRPGKKIFKRLLYFYAFILRNCAQRKKELNSECVFFLQAEADPDMKKHFKKSERAGPHPIGQKGQLVKRSLGPKS